MEKVTYDGIDANKKLLKLFEQKFEKKVLEKVLAKTTIRQVEISNLVNNIDEVVKNIIYF